MMSPPSTQPACSYLHVTFRHRPHPRPRPRPWRPTPSDIWIFCGEIYRLNHFKVYNSATHAASTSVVPGLCHHRPRHNRPRPHCPAPATAPDVSCNWDHAVCSLVWLASFMERPCHGVCQGFVPFRGRMA